MAEMASSSFTMVFFITGFVFCWQLVAGLFSYRGFTLSNFEKLWVTFTKQINNKILAGFRFIGKCIARHVRAKETTVSVRHGPVKMTKQLFDLVCWHGRSLFTKTVRHRLKFARPGQAIRCKVAKKLFTAFTAIHGSDPKASKRLPERLFEPAAARSSLALGAAR
jgi:hypothetical protein